MAYRSLQHFISVLEENGELLRVKRFVDPILEIAEITDRFSKQPGGGKALLFEKTGTEFPVLTNAFGSERRICLALGVESLEDIRGHVAELLKLASQPRPTFWSKLTSLKQFGRIASWLPVSLSGKGECQQVAHFNPDLGVMPILKCWPFDGGRFLTLPMVHTVDPETGHRNVGMYRMQVLDSVSTGMHWHKHKTGAKHFLKYQKLGKPMPVAVTLGGDPAYTYSATAPLPDNIDEYIFAGFLRKKKVKLVRCLTVDLEVPEDVDFVIEGFIDTDEEPCWEGPFGDHTGFYSLADWYPRFRVTCITHKKEAVYPATIVGIPPMEDAYFAKATERIFLEPIRQTLLPELDDMVLPIEGVAHNIALVKTKKEFDGQPYRLMNALWGAGQMMFNKILVAFPADADLSNGGALLMHICQNVNPKTDIFFGKGPLDVLDHASNEPAFGSKLFIDATRNLNDELTEKIDIAIVESAIKSLSPEIVCINSKLIEQGIPVAVISIRKKNLPQWSDFIDKLQNQENLSALRGLVVVDMERMIDDLSLVLWFISGNVDPQRDIKIVTHSEEAWTLVVDGTRKVYPSDRFSRLWPNVVLMDAATIERIDEMWSSLEVGEFIESPSLKLLHLSEGNNAVLRIE